MDIREVQSRLQISVSEMAAPFRSGTEIMLALIEEVGEVGREVALHEKVGSKAEWSLGPSSERLTEEIRQATVLLLVLANHFGLDMDDAFRAGFDTNATGS